jgi:uncharacterized repeat protein (TIGR03806 family)
MGQRSTLPPSVLSDCPGRDPWLGPGSPTGQRGARQSATFLVFLALLLVSSVVLSQAAPSDSAILSKSPPKLLSEFGFFDDLKAQKPAEGVVPFQLNTPLFSDRAVKRRFVYMPQGKAAKYDAAEAFDFPVGAALIKTFAFPADYRKPDQNVRLTETRVLLRQEAGWQAWAYVWNGEQTDAMLKIAGAKVDVKTIDEDGVPLAFTYSVPNKNQCKACHAFNGEIVPLGPKARNLNRNLEYGAGAENQLAHWAAAGMLDDAASSEEAPRVADWRDAGEPVEARARAWLDVNCAHCHISARTAFAARPTSFPMTPEVAMKVGMAAGTVVPARRHRHRVVIGKDTRLSGYMIETPWWRASPRPAWTCSCSARSRRRPSPC